MMALFDSMSDMGRVAVNVLVINYSTYCYTVRYRLSIPRDAKFYTLGDEKCEVSENTLSNDRC